MRQLWNSYGASTLGSPAALAAFLLDWPWSSEQIAQGKTWSKAFLPLKSSKASHQLKKTPTSYSWDSKLAPE